LVFVVEEKKREEEEGGFRGYRMDCAGLRSAMLGL
jgi:hypothetical protein